MCTFSWIDHCMYVVDSAIPVDVSMCGVVGRETKAAQGTTLVQMQHINTLRKITHSLVHEDRVSIIVKSYSTWTTIQKRGLYC